MEMLTLPYPTEKQEQPKQWTSFFPHYPELSFHLSLIQKANQAKRNEYVHRTVPVILKLALFYSKT